MAKKRFSAAFLSRLRAVTGKRSRVVVDHILKHGFTTTEELKDSYGYSHPPRAVRDVHEQGIPIERFPVTGKDGRTIAAYRFGDPETVRTATYSGRKAVPKTLKKALVERDGLRCAVCQASFPAPQLQVDHRVPYEVIGDLPTSEMRAADFMLVCGSCNRAKSWSCEHCSNWVEGRLPQVCEACYWASPLRYQHVATEDVRRLDLIWKGDEVTEHSKAADRAAALNVSLPEFVKDALRRRLNS